MNNKQAVLYIDDTGKVGDGTYVAVPLIVDTDETSEWETVEEKCRGEQFKTESGGHQGLSLSGTLKFKKSDTILQRFVTAFLNQDQIGLLNYTGDRTVIGNQGWEFNGFIKSLGRPMPDGDYVKYSFSAVPHSDNTDTNLPQFVTTTV